MEHIRKEMFGGVRALDAIIKPYVSEMYDSSASATTRKMAMKKADCKRPHKASTRETTPTEMQLQSVKQTRIRTNSSIMQGESA